MRISKAAKLGEDKGVANVPGGGHLTPGVHGQERDPWGQQAPARAEGAGTAIGLGATEATKITLSGGRGL